MTPHGPDTATYESAIDDAKASGPQKLAETTLAFMFEVNATPRVTAHALGSPCIDKDYYQVYILSQDVVHTMCLHQHLVLGACAHKA